MIQQYNEALSEEAEKITKDTEQLFTDISVSANKLTALKERIKTLWDTLKQQISDFFLESELNFCNYFRENIHWRSAKAMVSREGHWTNAPIYHEYADYCQRHVTQESERILKQMRGYVEELKNDDDSDEMTAFVNSCINKMESEYKNLLKHIWSETYSLCDNALTSTFWQSDAQVQSGSGYYDRLMKAIRIQMRRTGLAVKTNDKILELTDRFFNEILQAIEE